MIPASKLTLSRCETAAPVIAALIAASFPHIKANPFELKKRPQN
jgi:hypothetical protein